MTRLETVVPPPIWMLLVAAAMFGLERLDLGLGFTGDWRRLVAAAIGLVAVAIAGAGIVQFGRARTTVDPHAPEKASALVDGGIYRLTRNPMYVGLSLILVGWGVALSDGIALVVGPVAFVVIITRLQILPEERVLRARFGAPYDAFCARTRRWL